MIFRVNRIDGPLIAQGEVGDKITATAIGFGGSTDHGNPAWFKEEIHNSNPHKQVLTIFSKHPGIGFPRKIPSLDACLLSPSKGKEVAREISEWFGLRRT